jgi:cell division septation protein DedD
MEEAITTRQTRESEVKVAVNIQPKQPPVKTPEPAPPKPVQFVRAVPPPKPVEVEIIPRLPDPANGKVYRLQIGAFSASDTAYKTALAARAAGFDVALERNENGSIHRALVINVPSAMVNYAAQRLGQIGIKQIWVRE